MVSTEPESSLDQEKVPSPRNNLAREKVRIRFRKDGPLRFVGHNDLMRCWDRLLRRTGLPIRFSEGFHPKPILSSPLSLGLGLVGAQEVLEIELTGPVGATAIAQRLAAEAPQGLTIVEVSLPGVRSRAAVVEVEYRCPLPPEVRVEHVSERLQQVLACDSLPIQRHHPHKPDRCIDIRPMLRGMWLSDNELCWRVRVTNAGTVRPQEALACVGLGHLPAQGVVLTRSRVELGPA